MPGRPRKVEKVGNHRAKPAVSPGESVGFGDQDPGHRCRTEEMGTDLRQGRARPRGQVLVVGQLADEAANLAQVVFGRVRGQPRWDATVANRARRIAPRDPP